jgi:dTDP-4-dehydrorhamnose reductase
MMPASDSGASRTRPLALVTGAGGQLGSTIGQRLASRWSIVAQARGDLDLSDSKAIRDTVAKVRPDVIVNCAAYTDVDGAETAAAKALTVNGLAVGTLARAAREVGAPLVHYSTDFVFDGRGTRPYTEDDPTAPESAYAASKLLGEWFAADAPRHFVLRVESLFGGPHRRSSIDRIVDALVAGAEARVFSDRIVTPSFVDDVADATEALLRQHAAPGVYHCVNSGQATWLEVGEAVLATLQPRPAGRLVPVKVADVPMKAKRPQYCALSNAKLRAAGIEMRDWRDALSSYLHGIRRTTPAFNA